MKLNSQINEGRNVKRFREMLGMKQDALAAELGDDWNQQKISLLEQKETIDPIVLNQVSAALKIPVEAIQNFDEERAVNVIANTFGDNAFENSFNFGTIHFHPLDKLIQLHDEKILLYERMLKEKDDLIVRIDQLLSLK